MLVLVATLALACDDPVFRTLAAPAVPASGKSVVTGDGVMGGLGMVGARFTMLSDVPIDGWKAALANPERQDDWVPARFGYDLVEKVDKSHMYLQVNVGLLFGAVKIRRQLVAELDSAAEGARFVTCWRRVDPAPFQSALAAWPSDAEWQNASAGWWSVEATPKGTVVGHQWWTEAAGLPTAIVKFGASRTLPDLLDAFEERARSLSGGS